MTGTVYAVYTEGWHETCTPVLKQLFYNKTDADAYAEELRKMEEKPYGDERINKVYWDVTVEELEIR